MGIQMSFKKVIMVGVFIFVVAVFKGFISLGVNMEYSKDFLETCFIAFVIPLVFKDSD